MQGWSLPIYQVPYLTLFEHFKSSWITRIEINTGKLRKYRTFKNEYKTEDYLSIPLSKKYRSSFTKFRSGVAPIRVETGRYENLKLEERICPICKTGVEDEFHVLFTCSAYDNFRNCLFNHVKCFVPEFDLLSEVEKFTVLFSHIECYKLCAKTCFLILQSRRWLLYNWCVYEYVIPLNSCCLFNIYSIYGVQFPSMFTF